MAAPAAQTVTYLAAGGQTITQIYGQVKERLAGQASPAAGLGAAGSSQGGFMNLGSVRDGSGNLYSLAYDPVANVIYSANTFVA